MTKWDKKERRREEVGGLDGRKLKCPHEVTPLGRSKVTQAEGLGWGSDWRPGLLVRLAAGCWLAGLVG